MARPFSHGSPPPHTTLAPASPTDAAVGVRGAEQAGKIAARKAVEAELAEMEKLML